MGLLFQPRRAVIDPVPQHPSAVHDDIVLDRGFVFRAALEAVLLGDGSHFDQFFSDDVEFASPHRSVTSRTSVQKAFGAPEDALSDVRIVIRSLDAVGVKLIGEWRLDATFSHALVFDDDLLIEPTGGPVQLLGMSVAEFNERRIATFRHYFDDSELLDQVPGVAAHVRWTSARHRAPGP